MSYPDFEKHLEFTNDLSPIEKDNVVFSLQLKNELKKNLQNLEKIPLVYIGAGGDLLSALLVSGAKKVILIDDHDFLAKNGEKGRLSEVFPNIPEMLNKVESGRERIGVLTWWQNVRPALQMIAHLEKIGVQRSQIEIATEARNAKLKIKLGGDLIEVDYISERVDSEDQLLEILKLLKVKEDYGLLAKGGASEAVQNIVSSTVRKNKLVPAYFIVDDPRALVDRVLSKDEEQGLFPGYDLIEQQSSKQSGWGYSFGAQGGDRALIGIRR